MTKDEFRAHQKPFCGSGAPNKVGIYGCPCCRMLSNLNHFKKVVRKVAKARFRQATKKFIRSELNQV